MQKNKSKDKDKDKDKDKTVILNHNNADNMLRGWLVMLDFLGNPLKSYELNKMVIAIGRDPLNDIVINDKTVSRVHCSIEYNKDHYSIIEKESVNGILINHYPVTESILEDGMNIQLGEIHFFIKLL